MFDQRSESGNIPAMRGTPIMAQMGWLHTPVSESMYRAMQVAGPTESLSLVYRNTLQEQALELGCALVEGSARVWERDGEPTFSVKIRPDKHQVKRK